MTILRNIKTVAPGAVKKKMGYGADGTGCGTTSRDRGMGVLLQAERLWLGMDTFRRVRERCKRYTYGDQWGDVLTVNGRGQTEKQYLLEQGAIPLTNNLIRRLVRSVIGVYRGQSVEPTCIARDRDEQTLGETMSTVLQCNMQLNRAEQLQARTLEEYLISGLAVQRKWYGWRQGRCDCWTDYVQPNNFFIDADMRDLRGWDCRCVGEIHDVPFQEVAGQFARTPRELQRLKELYALARLTPSLQQSWSDFGAGDEYDPDFLIPRDPSLCRVIEVWKRESAARYRCHDLNSGEYYIIETGDYKAMVEDVNEQRLAQGQAYGMAAEEIPLIQAEWFVDNFWYYYFLTPQGEILAEGATPYEHGSHPYVFSAYPFIDGEIHSFVSDIIDQQRYVNRLITLNDMVIRSSSKGVLIVPRTAIPAGGLRQMAEAWVRPNGMVVYEPNEKFPTLAPHQLSSNSTNIGINEMLSLQLKFFEDITGVSGPLQGKAGWTGMSGVLYAQQTQNATTSLADLLQSFGEFVRDGAVKDVHNIQQFYDTPRIATIAGRSSATATYEPALMQDVEFDLSIVPSAQTPVYRALANDYLMQIFQTGQIGVQQLLEAGDFPFADRLLQTLKAQKEQMAAGEQPQEVPQDLREQVQEASNPEAVAAAQRFLGRE